MNQLLASLPERVRDAVHLCSAAKELPRGLVLAEAGAPFEQAIFPDDAVISTVAILRNGGTVELATTGCEGVVSPLIAQGATHAAHRDLVQVPGSGIALPVHALHELCAAFPEFHAKLTAYARAYTIQALQSVACNGVHSVDERCARWLLMTQDRVGRHTFQLTQEFLSEMLGVSRAAVNLVARSFQRAGFIEYQRGEMTIVDRAALEKSACECYAFIQQAFEDALPNPFCR